MARKSAAVLPPKKMTDAELLLEHDKEIATIRPRAKSMHRGRIKNAAGVPSGDHDSREVIDIVSMAIDANVDALEWRYGEVGNELTARQWAENIVRAIRYGVPTAEYEGEGFHIRDDDNMGEGPECKDCQEEA